MAGSPGTPLILASGSPRRSDMLARLGLEFEVVPAPAGTEAAWSAPQPPLEFALRMAAAKARAVAGTRPEALVVGADTIVVLDEEVLGKPADADAARRMLSRLSGREHLVHTGVAIVAPGGGETASAETSAVCFRELALGEIEDYVATGEPLDKAGAYGIQAYGASLIREVRGCTFNVMGLPITLFLNLLAELGWEYRIPGRLLRSKR